MTNIHLIKSTVICTLFSTALISCNFTLSKNQTLLDAEAAYHDAKNKPEIVSHAAPELDKAKKALDQAAAAKTSENMSSLSYIATNEIKSAQAIAEKAAYEALILELSKEKDILIMEALKKNEKAQSRAKQPKKTTASELDLANVKQTARGMVMILGNVLFKSEQADMLPSAENLISQLANALKKYPDRIILIEGHADNAGSISLNQQLSENRAWSVRNALINQGISADRINATGLGSTMPVTADDTEEGHQQNNRVEVILPN